MATKIKFGFDDKELGTAEVVNGKIRLGYADRADAEYMTGVLETYHAQMTDEMGYEADNLKPEELLSHVAARMRGRAWAEDAGGGDAAGPEAPEG